MSKKKKIAIVIARLAVIALVIFAIVAIKMLGIKAGSPDEGGNGTQTQNVEEPQNNNDMEQTRGGVTRGAGEQDISRWDLNKVNVIEDTEGVKVPVPKGYVASSISDEHTVNNGFVIYEGEEAVTEENKETVQTTRNQWVWVPVDNMEDIYFTDSDGKKHGQLWNFSNTGRTKRSYSATNYREPDVLASYDKSTYLPQMLTEENQTKLKKELTENFEETINSIEKYGGFYIGRYETGDLSKQKAKVVKGNEDIHTQTWYTMYRKSKEILQNENGNVRTSMIWGSLWDHTLNWLVTSGNKTYADMKDSTSWGNYYNSTVDGHGSRRPTGYREEWKANNIYDMAGNVWDWTLEAYNIFSFRVYRGGDYDDFGYNYPASSRSSFNPNVSNGYIRYTCPTLYKVALSPNSVAL